MEINKSDELFLNSDENYKSMINEVGKYSIVTRLAQLLLFSTDSKYEISKENFELILQYLKKYTDALGFIDIDLEKVIKSATNIKITEKLLEESVELFKKYFSTTLFETIGNDVTKIAKIIEEQKYFSKKMFEQFSSNDPFDDDG